MKPNAVWSSLHEPVLIYGSFHGSVFKSSLYRVQNGYKFESPVTEFGSSERVQNAVTCHQTHREEGELIHTPMHSHMYPYKHATRVYTHGSNHIHTHIQVYTYIYTINMHTYT